MDSDNHSQRFAYGKPYGVIQLWGYHSDQSPVTAVMRGTEIIFGERKSVRTRIYGIDLGVGDGDFSENIGIIVSE